MKIAFRNFLTTLRRYKASSLLNIVGLTLAFTAFYIILVQVWWEFGYNRSLRDAERIYLVQSEDWYEPGKWSSWLNQPINERAIASSPLVEAGGCIWGGFGDNIVWRENAAKMGYDKFELSTGGITAPLVDVFGFRALAGDVHDISKPNSVLISRMAAETLGVGVGDMIWLSINTPSAEAHEVVAIFEDFPKNSLMGGCQIAYDNMREQFIDNMSEWSFNYYIKLHPGADPADFERRLAEVFAEIGKEQREKALAAGREMDDDEDDDVKMRLVPITNLYFSTDSRVPCDQGSAVTTYTLLGIAVLVIALAFINFVNFFFALVPMRIRTVNTFKVFGAPTLSLRFSFVFEAVGLVIVSLLCAWYLAIFVKGTEFASYISASLALSKNIPVVLILIVVAVAMALAASLYPAYYITSFAPAMVIKGSFAGTPGGRRLRGVLLGFQFFIATVLIVATSFIQLQHRYMMNYDMGFDKRNLYSTYVSSRAGQAYNALRGKLLADPQVADVTGARSRMVSVDRMGWGRDFKGKQVNFQTYIVQWNFLQMMGIPIVEGRDFLESDTQKEMGTMIFNDVARREFEMVPGDHINGFIPPDEEIVGFCADFNFQPLQYAVAPFCFYVMPTKSSEKNDWYAPRTIYIRTTPEADPAAVAEHIRRSVVEIDPRTLPGDIAIRSFDLELGYEYSKEQRLTTVVGLFALLAVGIALMGVFGLVLFETQHRRREIAVRKVMGATTTEILEMFNRRYAIMVLVSFVVAVPVTVWFVSRWLTGFAYRVPIHWWVFAGALVLVLGVTLLTVTIRSWRAAEENPANSVKSE